MARRDDREYREYLSEEQRSQRGSIVRRMQPDFHHGLLGAHWKFQVSCLGFVFGICIRRYCCAIDGGCRDDKRMTFAWLFVRNSDLKS